jgi:molybdopterin molybdotransferase
MILDVKEAMRLVAKHSPLLEAELEPLGPRTLGRALGGALVAGQPSPRWDVSAMDGYAVRSGDFPAAYAQALPLHGTALAGARPLALHDRGAVCIMTGAVIPTGADAVVPKEFARSSQDAVQIDPAAEVAKHDHIRFAGEEVQVGLTLAEAGTVLSSRWIGFLSGLGFSKVPVVRRPKVALLISGDELRRPGTGLQPGQIHDSNGPMLQAALAEEGIACRARRLRDSAPAVESALRRALEGADLVLLSGGVSVGDADHSREAFRKCGVETLFWGVAQKPGKPLFFGSRGGTLVFGLPGNPAAAWVCFHQYVGRTLRIMQGLPELPRRQALALKPPRRDETKTLFLKARLSGSEVRLLDGQQSHMLRSLAEANALAMVAPEERGSLLEVFPL